MRKIISILVCMLIMVIPNIIVFAESAPKVVYANAVLPDVIVNAQINNENINKDNMSIRLSGEELKITNIQKISDIKTKRCAYFVVDLSTSITDSYFNSAIKCIKSYVVSMDENDSICLITFGKKVNVVLKNENDKEKILSAILDLKNNQAGTVFKDAIMKMIDMANVNRQNVDSFDSQFAFIFSDGIEYNDGGKTQNEIKKKLNISSLPIYAMCAKTEDYRQNGADEFRDIINYSNGQFYSYNSHNATKVFASAIKTIENQYVISAQSDKKIATNDIVGITVKYGLTSERVLLLPLSKDDKTAPYVTKSSVDKNNKNQLSVVFSENIVDKSEKTIGKNNVSVENESSKSVSINDIKYEKANDKYVMTIYFDRYLKNGKYTIKFNNIVDESNAKNELEKRFDFNVSNSVTIFQYCLTYYWYAFAAIGFVILILLLIFVICKKKNLTVKELFTKTTVEKQYYIEDDKSNAKKIKISVIDNGKTKSKLTVYVKTSLIFGRSDICNVVFDDKKMSRQHFSIGLESDNVLIVDLETTNGTFVNDQRIEGTQVLHSGDRIFAGLTTMIVEF